MSSSNIIQKARNKESSKSKKKQSSLHSFMLSKPGNLAPMARKIVMKHVRDEYEVVEAEQNKRKKLAMSEFDKQCRAANSHLKTSTSKDVLRKGLLGGLTEVNDILSKESAPKAAEPPTEQSITSSTTSQTPVIVMIPQEQSQNRIKGKKINDLTWHERASL